MSPFRHPSFAFILSTVFLDLLGYGMVMPLLPLYAQRLAAEGVQTNAAAYAGALAAAYAVMQLISGPTLGALSDRFGRKPLLLVCIAGTALSFALLATAESLSMLFVAVMLDGLTGGNLSIAYAYVSDASPAEKRAQALGLAGAAFGIGLTLGPAIGGLLSSLGFDAPAWSACALALISLVFSALLLPESLPAGLRTRQMTWRALAGVDFARLLRRQRGLSWLLLAIFAANLGFIGLQSNFPLFSQQRFAWTPLDTGAFFAFAGVCALISQGFLVRLVQNRWGDRTPALIGFAALALGLAGIAAAGQASLLYPVTALAAAGSGIALPLLSARASARVSPQQQGVYMGGTQILFSLASIGAPLIAGAAFRLIDASAPYWIGSALAMLAFIAAGRDGREPPA